MLFVGIDLGSNKTVISYFKDGKFDILTTAAGGRSYPSIVTYLKEHRLFSSKAAPKKISTRPRTLSNLRLLLHNLYSPSPDSKALLSSIPVEGSTIKFSNAEKVSVHAALFSFITYINKVVDSAFSDIPAMIYFTFPLYFCSEELAHYHQLCHFSANIYSEHKESLVSPSVHLISDLAALSFYYGVTNYNQKTLFSSVSQPAEEKHLTGVLFVDVSKNSTSFAFTVYDRRESKEKVFCTVESMASILKGGKFFDKVFLSFLPDYLQAPDLSSKKKAEIERSIEKARISLTSSDLSLVRIEWEEEELEFEVNRADFYEKLQGYGQEIAAIAKETMQAGIENYGPEKGKKLVWSMRVELSGGCGRMAFFKDVFSAALGIEPFITMDEKESVANGAALFAATASKMFKSSIVLKERADVRKFYLRSHSSNEEGFRLHRGYERRIGERLSLQYSCHDNVADMDFSGSTNSFVRNLVSQGDLLPLRKKISVKTNQSVFMKLFIEGQDQAPADLSGGIEDLFVVRSFMIVVPQEKIKKCLEEEQKVLEVTGNLLKPSVGKISFNFECELDYSPFIKESSYSLEYYELSPYGEVQKHRRSFLKLLRMSKRGFTEDIQADLASLGIKKREIKESCYISNVSNVEDLSMNELKNISEEEKKFQEMDDLVEKKKEARNTIEELLFFLEKKGVDKKVLESYEDWNLNEGIRATYEELMSKIGELEKLKESGGSS